VIAACVVVPQLVVVGMAPWVGRQSELIGRRPLLLLCFAALVLRALLFAFVSNPYVVVAVQVFDGISAAILGVLFPLVVADITRGTGRFSLGLGIVGSAVGIGASFSSIMAGYLFDHFGRGAAFLSLGGIAVLGLAMVWLLMRETRPSDATDQDAATEGLTPSERLDTEVLALGSAAAIRSR
jgi:MFS family permease